MIWDEKVGPLLVVEFLSPGTEAEDLGRFYESKGIPEGPGTGGKAATKTDKNTEAQRPPAKFVVYEEILKVLNYVVCDRNSRVLRYFRLVDERYQEQVLAAKHPHIWIPELGLGLGVWRGRFEGVNHDWLRWCDAEGNWCLTDTEVERAAKRQERVAKRQERVAKEAAEAAQARAEAAQAAAEAALAEERRLREMLVERLRVMGVDPETLL